MKLITYIALSFYLFSSVGLTFAAHFCNGEVKKVSLTVNSTEETEKGCCEKKCNVSSCRTNIVSFKISDVQKPESSKKLNIVPIVWTNPLTGIGSFSNSFNFSPSKENFISGQPVYLVCGSLLI